jgi:ureidoacrylate peracid hydrolase
LAREGGDVKEILGVAIPSTLREAIEPNRTAVVVVDVQNDLCAEGGSLHKLGRDLAPFELMIANIQRLLTAAREAGVRVIYLENTALPDYSNISGPWMKITYTKFKYLNESFHEHPFTVDGTWGQRTVEEIAPQGNDIVVKKWRSSGFLGTNLDQILRCSGIETVLAVGTSTEGCVYCTVRDAQDRDYRVVVAEDCVTTGRKDVHDAALALLQARVMVVPSADITAAWGR